LTATRKKRILSVQPVCDGGGSEHALIMMVRQLSADGWECHVVVPGPARLASEYGAAGATLHVLGMQGLTTSGGAFRWLRFAAGWPVSVFRLAGLVRRLDADVVHTNSLHSWYGWAAAALTRRPHVWHAREIVFQSPAALAVERFLARRFADRVIAVSEAVADQLDRSNVVVILDDADPSRFHPGRAGMFRSRTGIPDDAVLVGSVARVDTWKGFDVLLDAFPSVAAARPGTQLVVAGGPVPGKERYAADLEARAGTLPGVHWLGPRSDVPELMADLDVFVQVSTQPEPFGLVVVEALASGVPVVAGAEGGPLEILGPDATERPVPGGRLVPARDTGALIEAVLQLLPPTSSAQVRRARPPLRAAAAMRFGPVFDQVVQLSRRSPRLRPPRGRRRSDPGPSAPN
jgi:glycosyltransferase involved in cell wall biosynthesis